MAATSRVKGSKTEENRLRKLPPWTNGLTPQCHGVRYHAEIVKGDMVCSLERSLIVKKRNPFVF